MRMNLFHFAISFSSLGGFYVAWKSHGNENAHTVNISTTFSEFSSFSLLLIPHTYLSISSFPLSANFFLLLEVEET